MNILSFDGLASLSAAAEQSPRKRMNHNLHCELSDPVQRLAIAMEPFVLMRWLCRADVGQRWSGC